MKFIMKTKYLFVIGIFILLSIMPFALAGNSGSIWTTTNQCGEDKQDVNHYGVGDIVYINGANFDEENYDWEIIGLGGSENSGASCDPNLVVASGSEYVGEVGDVCFAAYVVENDDCGEYKVSFNNKKDNYRVDTPVVPEFGLILGLMTLLASAGVFFFVRRD